MNFPVNNKDTLLWRFERSILSLFNDIYDESDAH